MTDLLKRSLAPITDEAWKEIELLGSRTLKGNLTGRRLVDFSGPHGRHHAAVNLGSLNLAKAAAVDGVEWATRMVQPLMEIRAPFTLSLPQLEDIARGSKHADLDAVTVAARKAALFEETAIFKGFSGACILGLCEASSHIPMPLDRAADQLTEAVELAVLSLQTSMVGGPYALVLGTETYKKLMIGDPATYPVRKRVEALATGGIHWSPAVEGGVVLSRRGGDFELTVGQDMAIGYQTHDAFTVELYFTESFTFRVLEPAAVIELRPVV